MEKVTFEVETITPMFLAGNEQQKVKIPGRYQKFSAKYASPSDTDDYSWQKVAEFRRASSIRGLMRYWQRAIVGSLATTNAERMRLIKRAEEEIFGTTESGSAIQVRVEPLNIRIQDFTEEISAPNLQSNQYEATNKRYLLFSLKEGGNKKANDIIEEINQEHQQNTKTKGERRQGEEISAYQPPRQYIDKGSTFRVIFSIHSSVQSERELLQKATADFWLLANLGGIGSRSRRCAGSIKVSKVENNLTSLSFSEVEDVTLLQKQLKDGLQYIRQLWRMPFPNAVPIEIASFDILDIISEPKSCYIWILRNGEFPWSSAEDVMEDIAWNLQDYRSTLKLNKRAIFGLPIIVQKKDQRRGPGFRELYQYLADARMASPLLLRVNKMQNNQYVGIAVLFETDGKYINDMNDYQLIEEFVSERYPDALGVTL